MDVLNVCLVAILVCFITCKLRNEVDFDEYFYEDLHDRIPREFHDSEQFQKLLLLRISQDKNDEIDEDVSEDFNGDYDDNFEDESVNHKHRCSVKPMYIYKNADVQRLLDTIDRIAGFYEKNYNMIIVDGLFGLRVAEGGLKVALDLIKPVHKLYLKIKNIYLRIKNVSRKVYDVLKMDTTSYTKKFMAMIDRPFDYFRTWRNFDNSLVWKNVKKLKLNAKKGK